MDDSLDLRRVLARIEAKVDLLADRLDTLGALSAPNDAEKWELLRAEVEEVFGESSFFRVSQLLDADPNGPLALAIGLCVDMNKSPKGRATQLGIVLSKAAWAIPCGDGLYRLADLRT